jgi:hypothetical protein
MFITAITCALSVWTFRNVIRFYGEELLAPRPTTKPEDHPLSNFNFNTYGLFGDERGAAIGRQSHAMPSVKLPQTKHINAGWNVYVHFCPFDPSAERVDRQPKQVNCVHLLQFCFTTFMTIRGRDFPNMSLTFASHAAICAVPSVPHIGAPRIVSHFPKTNSLVHVKSVLHCATFLQKIPKVVQTTGTVDVFDPLSVILGPTSQRASLCPNFHEWWTQTARMKFPVSQLLI